MNSSNVTTNSNLSLPKAALIAGLGLLIMALSVPFAEFQIFPSLMGETPTETTYNILKNKGLFTTGIFLHLITLIFDIVVAWALYIFFKPVHKQLSLVTAWFRLLYTAMYLVVLANLVRVLAIIDLPGIEDNVSYHESVFLFFNSFSLEWSFGLILFSIHLLLLGILMMKSSYIPKVFGLLVLIAGIGYLLHTTCSFVLPQLDLDFLFPTFFGELIFMIWLLVKGVGLKEHDLPII